MSTSALSEMREREKVPFSEMLPFKVPLFFLTLQAQAIERRLIEIAWHTLSALTQLAHFQSLSLLRFQVAKIPSLVLAHHDRDMWW